MTSYAERAPDTSRAVELRLELLAAGFVIDQWDDGAMLRLQLPTPAELRPEFAAAPLCAPA